MDPGTALAVVSLCGQLFGAFIRGCEIFSNTKNFGMDYGDFYVDLVKERGRLEQWVKAWGISDRDGGFHRNLNPEDWQYRYAVAALARICALFANLKKLDSTYGVRAEKPREGRRLQLSRWTKSFLKRIKSQPDSSDKKQHTSNSGSPSHTIPPSPSPLSGGIPAIDIDVIAHLENLTAIETKILPPNLSLTDDVTRLSNATTELQKILPSYRMLRWAISDKGKSEKLIQQLTKYNDGLYEILPLPSQATSLKESGPISSVRNKHYTVPHNSSAIFTGRSDILEQIHQHFSFQVSSDTSREQRRFVLFGMGGSGKTQIAVKFAEVHRDSFWAILWIDASSHETAEKDFCDIARIAKVEENSKAAQQWLTSLEEEWLLIIDNADDPELDISKYFPTGSRGNILVTTRNPNCRRYGSHYEIKEMKEKDAIALLLKACEGQSDKEAQQWAPKIVKELGFLALAIDQAGAYIISTCEIGQYLDTYKRHRKDLLLQKSAQGASSYAQTVYTMWEVSFRKVEEENPVAADILQIFAFLHHEGISEEIFQRASLSIAKWKTSNLYSATGMPDKLMRILQPQDNDKNWDPFRFRNDVNTLLRYSLVRREKNIYSVHPLVHSWSRDRLRKKEQQLFLRLAICLLTHSITWEFRAEDYAFRRQLLSHIDASRIRSTYISFGSESNLKQVVHTARNFGLVYDENGRWREAEENQVQAVEASEKTFGKEHPQTLHLMGLLAWTHWNRGQLEEAEKAGGLVVEMGERIWGKEHPHILFAMTTLASVHYSRGQWEEAVKMQTRVCEARERALGTEHTNTLCAMLNLAEMYGKQGRLKESEKMGKRVLETMERILGEEHPDTLSAMENLAGTYKEQGRLEEAEKTGERVVEVKERTLGKEHPKTLASMLNLASTYYKQGRLEEAEKVGERVVEAMERTLGKDHPQTLVAIANLARTYGGQGRLEEAAKIEERVVEIRERIFGKEHPYTLIALKNLASTYKSQGPLEEAREIGARVAEANRYL